MMMSDNDDNECGDEGYDGKKDEQNYNYDDGENNSVSADHK
jgi:hypothetical protein